MTNSFYKVSNSDDDDLTLVLAIYFKSSIESINSKMKLEKIYFSQKEDLLYIVKIY